MFFPMGITIRRVVYGTDDTTTFSITIEFWWRRTSFVHSRPRKQRDRSFCWKRESA